MSELEKYIHELEQDVILDELNMKESALMLPAKKAKWVSRLMLEKTALSDLHKKKSQIIKSAVEEVKKESAVRLAQPVLEKAAERHPMVEDIATKIRDKEILIEFLEKVEKTMQSLGFDIKNLIELIKMETT
ncbi:MAG: hypothetical protein EB127_01430 [Alphaproteobacteria bacterium]|nr:hypothetical protein [Alphaproteobacteria bacterium]